MTDNVGINIGINIGINVGINEQRVLDALRADTSLSAVKIGQLLGITTRLLTYIWRGI